MKLQVIKNAVTSKATRQVLLTKKNSPALLFFAGTSLMITSTVMACNATLKLNEVLEENEKLRSTIEEVRTDPKLSKNYTGDDADNDLHILRVKTAVKIGKLYAPATVIGFIGLVLVTGSHVVLTRRNTALMAAYATLDRGLKEYRDRVKKAFGEERERELWRDGALDYVDEKDGKPHYDFSKSKFPGNKSMYARLWDQDTSTSYQKQPEYNLAFLTAKQNYLNDRLKSRGHVLLNDAYDELGLDRSKEGCLVGWVKGNGDNYIDFGIFQRDSEDKLLDFIMGTEGGIWIDFNVDGIVYDKI